METGSHVKSFSLLDLTRRSRWGGGSLRAFRQARVEEEQVVKDDTFRDDA